MEQKLTSTLFCSDTRSKSDPWTPDIHKKYPKRVWDVIVRTWRRQLHKYDVDADTTSPPLSPRTPPGEHASLHDSFNSEEDLIDSINDAIYKFQQDEEPSVEFEPSSVPDSSARSQLDSLIYSFDTPVSSSQSSHSSAAYMTPYSSRIASLGFLPEDSNSSMDSATSTSFFSDMGHSDMSENSSDSWHAMTFTPISLIGSPFNAPRSSSFSSNTFPHRSSRSASQHSHGSSASQHSSPYGAIGPVPRFNLPSSPAPSTPSKFAAQDENVENTSRLFWSSH